MDAIRGNLAARLGAFARGQAQRLEARSRRVAPWLERNVMRVMLAWALVMALAMAWRVASAPVPVHGLVDLAQLMAPYLVVIVAPLAGLALASAAFPLDRHDAPLASRLARVGRWHTLPRSEAAAHPAYGPSGFMASLLVGLLLNVVVRGFEFAVAVPAFNQHAPVWGVMLYRLFAADLASMTFMYMLCFVMALRGVPLFPRTLIFAWLCDLVLQLAIAHHLANAPGLPAQVAGPLSTLLVGNVHKVLISVAIWLPYLLLSERVNVTYRWRVACRTAD